MEQLLTYALYLSLFESTKWLKTELYIAHPFPLHWHNIWHITSTCIVCNIPAFLTYNHSCSRRLACNSSLPGQRRTFPSATVAQLGVAISPASNREQGKPMASQALYIVQANMYKPGDPHYISTCTYILSIIKYNYKHFMYLIFYI